MAIAFISVIAKAQDITISGITLGATKNDAIKILKGKKYKYRIDEDNLILVSDYKNSLSTAINYMYIICNSDNIATHIAIDIGNADIKIFDDYDDIVSKLKEKYGEPIEVGEKYNSPYSENYRDYPLSALQFIDEHYTKWKVNNLQIVTSILKDRILVVYNDTKYSEQESSKNTDNLTVNPTKDFITIDNLDIYNRDLGIFNYNDAVKKCNELGDGWRLPTSEELRKIADNIGSINNLNTDFKSYTKPAGNYNNYDFNGSNYWGKDFKFIILRKDVIGFGKVFDVMKGFSDLYYKSVRPVRLNPEKEKIRIAENKKEAKQSIEYNRSVLEGLFSKEDLRKHNEENKKKKNGIHTCKSCGKKFKGVGFKIKGEKVTTGDESGVVGLFYGLETIQPDFCTRECGYDYLLNK